MTGYTNEEAAILSAHRVDAERQASLIEYRNGRLYWSAVIAGYFILLGLVSPWLFSFVPELAYKILLGGLSFGWFIFGLWFWSVWLSLRRT